MEFQKKIQSQSEVSEISLKKIINIINRNKKLIGIITFSITFLTIAYSYIAKPVWRGSFQILLKTNNSNSLLNSLSSSIGELSSFDPTTRLSGDAKTQEIILKSPSVLMPVFKNSKKDLQERGIDTSKLRYEDWLKKYLKIYFEQGSNVLTINYEDINKESILLNLKNISAQYQNYSKRDLEKNLSREISYLTEQELIYKEKSIKSLKKFNEFSIKNNLGNIDGFIKLVGNDSSSNKNITNRNIFKGTSSEEILKAIGELKRTSISSSEESNAGERFTSLFNKLEEYETLYTDYSSKLKPNSKTLLELKNKIDNLRESLRRPNEILIEFVSLKKEAEREQITLENIQNSLIDAKLAIVKQQFPWEIISEPTISKIRVSPKRREWTLIALLYSFTLSFLIAYLKEKKSGLFYEFEDIYKAINFNFIDTLYKYDSKLSLKVIEKFLKGSDYQDIKNSNIQLLVFGDLDFYQNSWFNNPLFDAKGNFKQIQKNDFYELTDIKNLLIVIEKGSTSKKELRLINKYLSLSEINNLGWFFVETKKFV